MVQKVESTDEEEANEELVVSFAYTVVDPRTVVVEVLTFAYLHTTAAVMAVPDVLSLQDSAVVADVLRSVGLVNLVLGLHFDVARVLDAGQDEEHSVEDDQGQAGQDQGQTDLRPQDQDD